MDQQFLEREKELFKLNAKLNARTKKIQVILPTKAQPKSVQIHTANNYFNYYEEQPISTQKETQDDGLELLCKKINISNQPVKKPQEIVYPLFNRQTVKIYKEATLDLHIHLPTGSLVSDGKSEQGETEAKSVDVQSMSVKNESMITRYSDDSSAIPPADVLPSLPMPPNLIEVIPKSMEKKNISNDGLLKYVLRMNFNVF